MVRKAGKSIWSFEQHYGYPYVGTKQQKEKLLEKSRELGGIAVDPRTGRIVGSK